MPRPMQIERQWQLDYAFMDCFPHRWIDEWMAIKCRPHSACLIVQWSRSAKVAHVHRVWIARVARGCRCRLWVGSLMWFFLMRCPHLQSPPSLREASQAASFVSSKVFGQFYINAAGFYSQNSRIHGLHCLLHQLACLQVITGMTSLQFCCGSLVAPSHEEQCHAQYKAY